MLMTNLHSNVATPLLPTTAGAPSTTTSSRGLYPSSSGKLNSAIPGLKQPPETLLECREPMPELLGWRGMGFSLEVYTMSSLLLVRTMQHPACRELNTLDTGCSSVCIGAFDRTVLPTSKKDSASELPSKDSAS